MLLQRAAEALAGLRARECEEAAAALTTALDDSPTVASLTAAEARARRAGVEDALLLQRAAEALAGLRARESELALAYHTLAGHSSAARGRPPQRAANGMANFLSLTARGDNLSGEEKRKLHNARTNMKYNFESHKKNSLYSLGGPRNQDPLLASDPLAHSCLVRAL